MSTAVHDGFMDTLVKFNSQTVGRDRIIRLLQYGSKLLAWTMGRTELNKEFAVKFQNLEYSLSTGRKLLRFGRFLDTLYAALKSLHLHDLMVRITVTMSRISQALYLLTDHIIWFGRMGLVKVNNAKWTRQSNKFWLLSIIFALVRDMYELWLAMDGELKVQKKKEMSTSSSCETGCPLKYWVEPTLRCTHNHKDVVVDTVKNVCDLWIPLTGLNYVKCSPGLIGLLGVISSAAAIASIVSPTLKLQPS